MDEEKVAFEYEYMLGASHVLTPEQMKKYCHRHTVRDEPLADDDVEWVQAKHE